MKPMIKWVLKKARCTRSLVWKLKEALQLKVSDFCQDYERENNLKQRTQYERNPNSSPCESNLRRALPASRFSGRLWSSGSDSHVDCSMADIYNVKENIVLGRNKNNNSNIKEDESEWERKREIKLTERRLSKSNRMIHERLTAIIDSCRPTYYGYSTQEF